MRSLSAPRYLALTLLLLALALLLGCASAPPPPVVVTRTVTVPTPVVVKPDASLTADCPPEPALTPSGPLTVQSVLDELDATRAALATCRQRLYQLR